MALWRVHLGQMASYVIYVEADTKEEVKDAVWNSDQHPGGLCSFCSHRYDLSGDPEIFTEGNGELEISKLPEE